VIRSPRRRLTAIAAVGAVALGLLAGCRTDAGSAAYVGNTRITTDQVDTIAEAVPGQSDLSGPRVTAANLSVFNAAAAKYAASKGIPAPDITQDAIAAVANQQGITDPKAIAKARPWLKLEAETGAWVDTLMKSVQATTPTDADLRRLFTELKADFQPGTTFDQAKAALLQVPNLAQGVALRNQLEPAFKSYNISISPMYANNCVKAPCPAPYIPLVQLQTQSGGNIDVVNLPLTSGTASPPVVDLPAAVHSAPAQG
jgi:hypothetical protein